MGIFNRLFGGKKKKDSNPNIIFGRYSDSYKSDKKYDAWDAALEKFESQDYQESFLLFFEYLLDESQNNVLTRVNNGRIDFEILQGSKKIVGFVDDKIIKAEAKVAKMEVQTVGFLRRMVEGNFSLKYSRYALDDDNNLTLLFDSYLLDGSPYKLYYALKEIAVNADKQDDLLIDEFQMLKPINTGHLVDIDPAVKEIKYLFLQKEIKNVFHEIDHGKLNTIQYPGGVGYLMLNLGYKLDYLLKPEGNTMEALERIHRLYFAPDGKTAGEKNLAVRKEFTKLLERSKEELFKELYTASSTFGITSPSNHAQLVSFIDSELPNMDWYAENKHTMVALSIPGYIVGYSIFNYSFPKPDRELLHLYYWIAEPEYFTDLGFAPQYYDRETNRFDKRAIKYALDQIEHDNRAKFPKLRIQTGSLKYNNLVDFAKSYLLMIKALDLTRKS
jgi:hypothetical protein